MERSEMLQTVVRAISALGPFVDYEDNNGYPYVSLVEDLEKLYRAIRKLAEAT